MTQEITNFKLGVNMLKGIEIENFTNFRQSKIEFAENINIIFGDSGLGKSNLLKLIHAFVGSKSSAVELAVNDMSDVLRYIFDVKELLDLINYDAIEVGKNHVKFIFKNSEFNSGFTFVGRQSLDEFKKLECIYDIDYVTLINDEIFKRTYLPIKTNNHKIILNSELDQITIELDREVGGIIVGEMDRCLFFKTYNDRYIKFEQMASGKRKLALLSLLIKNGHISKNSILLMDDIDSSLDHRQQRLMVKVIKTLTMNNIQVFLVAKNYFFIKECDINFRKSGIDTQYINLFGDNNTEVEQSESLDGISNMSILNEELEQYDREQDLYK